MIAKLLQSIWRRSAEASVLVRYGFALVAAVAVSLLRLALNPFWGDNYPYIFFFPTTLFTALLGGLGPGLVSLSICGLMTAIWVLPPIGSLPTDPLELAGLAVYLFVDGMIAAIAAQHRNAIRRITRQALELAAATEVSVRLAAIVQSSEDAIIGKTLKGTITFWNPGATRLFGYRKEEAVGQSIRLILPPDRLDEEADVLRRLRRGETIDHFETVRLRKDGQRVDVSVTVSPIRDPAGTIIGASKIARDIGQRRQFEAERARREADLRILAEISKILASSLDYETTLRQAVRAVVPTIADGCGVELLGEDATLRRVAVAHRDPAKERLGEELWRRYPFGEMHPIRQAVSRGEPILSEEVPESLLETVAQDAEHLRLLRGVGFCSFIIVPLRRGERVLGTFSVMTSVESGRRYTRTDLPLVEELAHRVAQAIENARLYREARIAREAADAANRAKDEFLTVLSHELRTPLSAVYGWARMLRAGQIHDEPERARAFEAIERNANAQVQLIDDLLDVSRIITGKMRLDVRSLDLSAVIEAALDAVRPAAEAKGIRIQSVMDPRAGPITGDPARLQQVVWNLLMNAVKFTPKGGRMQVHLQRVNSHVEIVVSDTGEGIAADVLPSVFDRFRQGDSSSTRAHTGLGLGLALVRHLTELHGGSVVAQSEGKGKGATFIVKLPLAIADVAAGTTSRVHPTAASSDFLGGAARLDGLTVLVVDDDRDALDLVTAILTRAGATIRTCLGAPEALAVLRDWRPDVLVSDIEMPEEDGYALIRRVRALGPDAGGKTPAIALTAYGRIQDRMLSLSAGYAMHVPKPVDPGELTTIIASVAGRSPQSST